MSKENNNIRIRKIASSKQTAGGGFVFEDKVTAWFVSYILSNRIPFSGHIGAISRIDFQVRVDGWLFDDLLISTEYEGIKRKIAVSSKSNIQFGKTGPNNELLGDLWNQYLNVEKNVFNPEVDYLCIINSRLPQETSININKLLNFAKENNPEDLISRIDSNDKAFSQSLKKIFRGFQCPVEIATINNVQEIDTLRLLSRILFIEFDFEYDTSKDQNNIIEICKTCLSDSSKNKAQNLYTVLCSLRADQAPVSGFLDYSKLLNKLKSFELKGFSNHYDDWEKIITKCKSRLGSIPDTIGNKLSFSTINEFQQIENFLKNKNKLFILGKSGYGKSVLIKKYVLEKLSENNQIIWIDSQVIQSNSLEFYFGIKHSIMELIKKNQTDGYLIIDGIDRFFKDSEFDLIVPILSLIDTFDRWKIIFTCQSEDYDGVLEKMRRKNVLTDTAELRLQIDITQYVTDITTSFPELSELFRHTHLLPILHNLKYLDLLAGNVAKNSKLTNLDFVGETTIIDWVWQEEIESSGAVNSRFIKAFSEMQAQRLSAGVPISDFSIPEMAPVDSLKNMKVVYEFEDRLYFTHDLFGDWARYKQIRANKHQIKTFLLSKDMVSPLWCKAIRLYGIFLLENATDASEWLKVFNLMDPVNYNEKIIQDLLLESIIFSTNPFSYLIALWEYFKKNNGNLLHRFLDLFLLKATQPNQHIVQFVEENENYSLAEAHSYYRTPNHQYWFSILEFIFLKKDDFIKITKEKTIKIIKLWLEYTANKSIYRKECSEIALEVANWMFDFKHNGGYVKGTVDQEIYKAFLLAVDDYPNEVLDLALKLCKRNNVERKKVTIESIDNGNAVESLIFHHEIIRDKKQWDHGPYESVDGAFEKVCKYDNAFFPIIVKYPEKAVEILLALFIEEPREVAYGVENSDLDINTSGQWFPPFYHRGPFSQFLKYQPDAAIDFLVKLTNFATEQWKFEFKYEKRDIPKVSLEVDGKSRAFYGDENVYFWFRDNMGAPDVLVSALMSLEKFFYDKIDAEQDVDVYLSLILKQSNSIALLGLVNEIGKYNPNLFFTTLRPLLQVYKFYKWDDALGIRNSDGFLLMGASFLNKNTFDELKTWNNMPHRRQSLQNISVNLFLYSIDLREYYVKVTSNWSSQLQEISANGDWDIYLDQLITFYDFDNYVIVDRDEQNEYWEYREPKEIIERYREGRENIDASNNDFVFPFTCYKEFQNPREYTFEMCQELFNRVERYSVLDDDDPYSFSSGKHQMVLSGCALLIYHKDIWINDAPFWLQWIINYTSEAVGNYKLDKRELNQSQLGYSWSQFAARILAILWVSDVSNIKLRSIIAKLIIESHYDTISTFVAEVSKFLKWSDKDFVQLQNLIILWSGILYKNVKASRHNLYAKTKANYNIQRDKEKIVKDYVHNKIDTVLIDWSGLRTVEQKTKNIFWNNDAHIINGHLPGIDTVLLQHLFLSLPDVHSIKGDDRDHVLSIYKLLLDQVIFEIGDIPTDQIQLQGYPDQFQIWVLERIGNIIPKINDRDIITAEYFWKAILQYGFLAAEWVDQFCAFYFMNNIDNTEMHDNFFKEWKKMLDFASHSTAWKLKRHYKKDGLWESLLGVSNPMIILWRNDNYINFFKKIISENIMIMDRKAINPDIVFRLIQILKTKPGLSIMDKGLQVITKYIAFSSAVDKVEVPEGLSRVDFEYEDDLAQLISFLWEKNKEIINNSIPMLNHFKKIVLYLVARQNPIGLALQNRIME